MNLKKWGILGLAGALVLSSAVSTKAFQVKVDEDTFADVGFQIRVNYLNQPEDKDHDYRWNRFQVTKYRIFSIGQINKLVQYYAMVDANYNSQTYQNEAKLWEGGVQLTFAPEFILKMGKLRVPFSRNNLRARFVSPVMSSSGNFFIPNQFKEALKAVNPYPGGYKDSDPFKRTDFGVVLAGYIKNGLFKYYVSLFNEDRSNATKVWELSNGWVDANTIKTSEDKKSFEYDIRIEFTPTFWGFNSEKTVFKPHQREAETYLGKLDFMTIGLGYHHEKHLDGLDKATYGTSDLERDAWAADIAFEKTFSKKYIIGGETGYMYFDDTHLYETSNGQYKKGDVWTWYISGHFTYGEKIGMGYPGIGFRYEYINIDGKYNNEDDLVYDRYGLCFNYWFTRSTRIAVGVDFMKAKDALEKYFEDNNWDDSTTNWYVGVYAQF